MSTKPARRIHSLLLNLGTAAAALCVALLLAEFLVRLLAPQQLLVRRADVWIPDAGLGWRHRANVSTTINIGNGMVEFQTDEDGFRVCSGGRVPAERRILLLGDSFTEALQVDCDNSFSGRLEAGLASHFGDAVSVRNTGVGGWDPNQYLIQAKRLIPGELFDLVLVVLFLGNDIIDSERDGYPPRAPRTTGFRWPRRLSPSELADAFLIPITAVFESRSELYQLGTGQLRSIQSRAGLRAPYFPPCIRKDYASHVAWGVTAGIVAEIAAVGATSGIPTIVALIPPVELVDRSLLERQMARYSIDSTNLDIEQPVRRMTQELQQRGLSVIDLTPVLLAAAGDHPERLFARTDQHFSSEGHAVVTATLLSATVAVLESAGAGAETGGTSPSPAAPRQSPGP